MAVAAIRIAGSPRRSRKAAAAFVVASITTVVHSVFLAWLATRLLG